MIDRLGPARPGAPLPDLNDVVGGEAPKVGPQTTGMRVTAAQPGSNAQGMGFRPGDIVLRIIGRALPRGLDLTDFMDLYAPDDALAFVVDRRHGDTKRGHAGPLGGAWQRPHHALRRRTERDVTA